MHCIDADAMLARLEEWNTSDSTDISDGVRQEDDNE